MTPQYEIELVCQNNPDHIGGGIIGVTARNRERALSEARGIIYRKWRICSEVTSRVLGIFTKRCGGKLVPSIRAEKPDNL